MPEEEAFAVLVSIMQDFTMRDMYKPDMFYLGLCIYQFECMIQEFLPDLQRHFQAEHIHTSMYASSWFLTLFTNQFPLNVVSRIMDLFLSEVISPIDLSFQRATHCVTLIQGIEMIFRLGIALLELHQDELMLLSMEEMLRVGDLSLRGTDRRCREHLSPTEEKEIEPLNALIDTYE